LACDLHLGQCSHTDTELKESQTANQHEDSDIQYLLALGDSSDNEQQGKADASRRNTSEVG